jgi:hypothetical protein
MKTHNEKQTAVLLAAIGLTAIWPCLPILAVAGGPCGDCGHATGNDVFVHVPCTPSPLACPPDICEVQWLPPGTHAGPCEFTCVDAYSCLNTTYTGPVTTREGLCGIDCACYTYPPGFQDYAYGVGVSVDRDVQCGSGG